MLLILMSLCGLISYVSQHKHLLVHLSCHSITKTKQGPFNCNINAKRLCPNYLNPTFIWHCRLGHINEKCVELLHKDGLLSSFDFESFITCESCLLGKMTKTPFTGHSERASDLLGLVHTDVCGPMNSIARGGFQYFITFTDDFSRYGYIYLMRNKSESFEKFKKFQNEV